MSAVKKNDKPLEQEIIDGVSCELENKISELPTNNKTVIKALHQNEDGDSYLFIKLFKDKYVYDHAAGHWYYWNDHYWRFDELNHVPTLIKDIIRLYEKQLNYEEYAAEAANKNGKSELANIHENTAKLIKERVKKLQTLRRKNDVLTMSTQGKGSLGYPGNGWDTKPMLLACKNCTIDLEKGEFRDGYPTDYLKTISPVDWKGIDEPCPTWKKFMLDIFGQDQELVDFMQRLLGYGITGLTTEHIYPILWGEKGRNGKSTMLETLKYILGGLAYKAPASFFMQQKTGRTSGSADAELMAFRGARLVWGAETNEGDRLDTAKLKELVGDDTISARPPYGKRQIEFKPTHLLLLITNKRPRIPANDTALWRRIHLIPFLYSFVDKPDPENKYQLPIDKYLSKKLKKEASGILTWLVEGCVLWQRDGLNPPESVRMATKEYQAEEDIIGHFLQECCITGDPENPAFRETPKALYDAYKTWCQDVGHFSKAKTHFIKELKERFKMTRRSVNYFIGVTLHNSME